MKSFQSDVLLTSDSRNKLTVLFIFKVALRLKGGMLCGDYMRKGRYGNLNWHV